MAGLAGVFIPRQATPAMGSTTCSSVSDLSVTPSAAFNKNLLQYYYDEEIQRRKRAIDQIISFIDEHGVPRELAGCFPNYYEEMATVQ